MNCPRCEKKLRQSSRFCDNCGYQILKEKQSKKYVMVNGVKVPLEVGEDPSDLLSIVKEYIPTGDMLSIIGGDPNRHYCWQIKNKIPKGYTIDDDPNVSFEGQVGKSDDGIKVYNELILTWIPKKVFDFERRYHEASAKRFINNPKELIDDSIKEQISSSCYINELHVEGGLNESNFSMEDQGKKSIKGKELLKMLE